jgi:hypothetical protein
MRRVKLTRLNLFLLIDQSHDKGRDIDYFNIELMKRFNVIVHKMGVAEAIGFCVRLEVTPNLAVHFL